MKTIEVVAAVIKECDKIFTTQRASGEFKDMWEFPGGKMEDGETREEALIREIKEELETEITIIEFLQTIEYEYPSFHLIMHCFLCEVKSGNLTLLEHKAAKWLSQDELEKVNWLPADLELIKKLKTLALV